MPRSPRPTPSGVFHSCPEICKGVLGLPKFCHGLAPSCTLSVKHVRAVSAEQHPRDARYNFKTEGWMVRALGSSPHRFSTFCPRLITSLAVQLAARLHFGLKRPQRRGGRVKPLRRGAASIRFVMAFTSPRRSRVSMPRCRRRKAFDPPPLATQ
jgi:hypothetical protein